MQPSTIESPAVRPRSRGAAALLAIALALAAGARQPGPAAARPADDDPHECLALAVYWEAGGETRESMAAVASVVLNRRAHPEFPPTVCGVVRQGGTDPGCQFHFWCDGRSDTPRNAAVWALAREVAAEALADLLPDPTGGALFFHAARLGEPPWRIPRERTARIGRHVYYR